MLTSACGSLSLLKPSVSPATPSASATQLVLPTATPQLEVPTPSSAPTLTPAPPTPEASLMVTPTTARAGADVKVSGTVPNCSSVTILSNAFSSQREYAGVPAVTTTVDAQHHFSTTVLIPIERRTGRYAVTARACGAKLGVTAFLQVSPPA
ncbi:MAG TPA: hypothetical protein VE219_04110 [Candidatus Sulfotelmatobacter sp.]|nr:hypothetical protein [Candidatus Sulfotelmatobacter sp.]